MRLLIRKKIQVIKIRSTKTNQQPITNVQYHSDHNPQSPVDQRVIKSFHKILLISNVKSFKIPPKPSNHRSISMRLFIMREPGHKEHRRGPFLNQTLHGHDGEWSIEVHLGGV